MTSLGVDQTPDVAPVRQLGASGGVRRFIRRAVGRLMATLVGCHGDYLEQARQDRLARIATIDPTANVPATAGFANNRNDPACITIGAHSAMLGEIIIFPNGGAVSLGERSFVGPGSRIWSAASVTIGNYVLIAHGVNIHDNSSHALVWRARREEIEQTLPTLRLTGHGADLNARHITIEDDVWIGFGASVLGGVHIGRGAIIGAGTVVTKDVAAFTVVVGNPMRVIRTLEHPAET